MFIINYQLRAAICALCLMSGCISENNVCSDVNDCACGEQCVDREDLQLCHGSLCVCLTGCAVGDIYLPPGVRRSRTYCNLCSCPRNRSNGIPRCTRGRWCNLPDDNKVYQTNPACFQQGRTFYNSLK
ncbi:uncharacterized protein LOC132739483 [Ruditapes philippinarum]|uniref:uncharacterized protein LOC132739483 n=1 Tax=Ruditapes philippinarum TaxID=129788 RepID=UPI00295BF858|nr:uncharacterized protein LOC132739483 [Ruditapes philippinarum]